MWTARIRIQSSLRSKQARARTCCPQKVALLRTLWRCSEPRLEPSRSWAARTAPSSILTSDRSSQHLPNWRSLRASTRGRRRPLHLRKGRCLNRERETTQSVLLKALNSFCTNLNRNLELSGMAEDLPMLRWKSVSDATLRVKRIS